MTDPATRRPKPSYYLSDDGRVVFPKKRSILGRIVRWLLVLSCLTAAASVIAVIAMVLQADRTPREWAAHMRYRGQGNPTVIESAMTMAADWLNRADRLTRTDLPVLPPALGASAARSGATPPGRPRPVASLQELADAAASAQPGDVIQLAAGQYHFQGQAIPFTQPGTAAAPIIVRAATLGDAVIESDAVETFKVFAPFWRFENLTMRGVCADHSNCEHAFHIVGAASNTVIRNNRLEDYNAHIKINGEDGKFPDHGVIEGNTMTDTRPRVTANPITPIDLVAASNWRVSGNIITDFVRGVAGEATYGGFFKGAGQNNVFERNVVLCEWKLRSASGSQVGFSLGGGGTDVQVRREQGDTGLEQVGGVIRDNLIAFCSDDGIYLNRAAHSIVDHNTLLDTAGIDGRFLETSGQITANIVDGAVRARDEAALTGWDNDRPYLLGLFVGWHPQRRYYREPARLDLTWRDEPEQLPVSDEPGIDLCGRRRSPHTPAGAFEDYSKCLQGQ